MKRYVSLFVAGAMTLSAWAYELPCTSPEAQGLESKAVGALIDSLMSLPQAELHNLTVLRHGNIVAQASPSPFTADMQHELFSVSKTFTAAAVGLAIEANRLDLDDRLGAILPEALPDSVSPWLADVTVDDLLTMTSGMTVDWAMRGQQDHWAQVMASKPMVAEPGKKFSYDSMSTYLLSAIVQKVMGRSVLDLLTEKVFEPLEITDFAWDYSPDGVTTGGWGLWMKPDGLARFGQMLLDGGRWQGRQILPQSWVKEMMTEQVSLVDEGYNYQMWKCNHKSASRADGAWGQFIVVMPEEDMVVVVTQCARGVAARQLPWIWGLLSPATHDQPLAEGKDYKALIRKIDTLAHPFPKGKATSRLQQALYGKTVELPQNSMNWKSLRIEAGEKGEIRLLTLNDKGETDTLSCGYRHWETSVLNSFPPDERSDTHARMSGHTNSFYTAGAYAWRPDGTLDIKLHYTHWYSSLSIQIKPADGRFEVTMQLNYEGEPRRLVVEQGR